MKKKNELFSVEEALSSMFNHSGLKDKSKNLKIYRAWPGVVGKKIAENTCIETVNRGTLIVNVSSPVWMQELHFLKDMIIEKLETALGEKPIKDIRFKTGHVPLPGTQKKDFSDVSLDEVEIKMAQKKSEGINDPEVRNAFQHLMEIHLKSNKNDEE